MQPEKIDDFLAQEYLTLQKFIEDYDARALTIKAWSITFSAAGLGLAYAQSKPVILLIAAAGSLVFWLIEALWKMNQQNHFPRVREIEAHFAEAQPLTRPFQINASWQAAFNGPRGWRGTWKLMAWLHVALPHLLVAAAGVALYLLMPPGPAPG